MKKSDITLHIPQRQSKFAIIVIIVKFLRAIIRQAWPILLILFWNSSGEVDRWQYFSLAAAALGIIPLIGSVLAYFKYYYHIDDDEIIIQKGLLKKASIKVPFERIQTVDFEKNIIHQIFDVVKVKIDTAGSGKNELEIDALELPVAEALRSAIMSRKAEASLDQSIKGEIAKVDSEPVTLIRLGIADLVKIGISQNHFRTAAVIAAFAGGLINELAIFDDIEQMVDSQVGEDMIRQASWIFWALVFIPLFLLISFVGTLIMTMLKYHNLTVSKNRQGFKLSAGLFNKVEKTAIHQKVQIISWQYNLLQKLFKLYRLNIKQASPEFSMAKNFVIPGCKLDQVKVFVQQYFPPHIASNFSKLSIHRAFIYRYSIYMGLLPTLAGIGMFVMDLDISIRWLLILVFPIAVALISRYHKNWSLEINNKALKITTGIFGRKYSMIRLFKIQAVQISRSWYQRRHELASIKVTTASGDLSIPYIKHSEALDLKNYLLYHIESSKNKWM